LTGIKVWEAWILRGFDLIMEKLQPTSKSFICALFGAMVLLLTGCETTNESIQLVQNQAEQGDADAQYALADTYLYYTDKEAAIQWY